MKKLLNIALKDLKIMFRDPSALVWMLAMPIALTLAMAFAFGRLTGDSGQVAGLRDIPVIIVDLDHGTGSRVITEAFKSADVTKLISATISSDEVAAREAVKNNTVAAAVIIPAGFSARVLPGDVKQSDWSALLTKEPAAVEVYSSPERPTSSQIVRGVAQGGLHLLSTIYAAIGTSVSQLINKGYITPDQAGGYGARIAPAIGEQVQSSRAVNLSVEFVGASDNSGGFDWMAYMAPSMAVMFLMFTVSLGGRSILAERQWGTLQRLLTSPTSPAQVLGGKVSGIFLTGLAQMAILIALSALAFGVRWGAPVALLVLCVATVFAATGWGALIAAYAKSPGQAMSVGAMIALVFAGLAGNFVPRQNYPEFLQQISLITPNAWALEGFQSLGEGGGMNEVLLPVVALTIMGVVLFAVATMMFRRQYK